MADQVMTSSSHMSAIVPELWSARFFEVLVEQLPFQSVISKDWEGEIRDLGDIINISTVPQFDDAIELAEDARNDADAVTISGQQLTINKRVAKDYIITKKSIAQSIDAMDKLREMAVFSILKKMEKTIIESIVPSAAAPDHQIPYDTGTTLALLDLLAGKELLDDQNCPMSDRHLVVDSPQLNDLFSITGFTSSDFLVSGAPVQTGQLPAALLGFMPHFTTLAGDVTYLFHSSFMTMAVQEALDIKEYDLGVDGKRAMRVNLDLLWGLKQLDNKRVVEIA